MSEFAFSGELTPGRCSIGRVWVGLVLGSSAISHIARWSIDSAFRGVSARSSASIPATSPKTPETYLTPWQCDFPGRAVATPLGEFRWRRGCQARFGVDALNLRDPREHRAAREEGKQIRIRVNWNPRPVARESGVGVGNGRGDGSLQSARVHELFRGQRNRACPPISRGSTGGSRIDQRVHVRANVEVRPDLSVARCRERARVDGREPLRIG